MTKAGCIACHTMDKKLVGPGVQGRRRQVQGAGRCGAKLTEKTRNGGKGVWGQMPMPPNPVAKIWDAELKAAVEWILKQ